MCAACCACCARVAAVAPFHRTLLQHSSRGITPGRPSPPFVCVPSQHAYGMCHPCCPLLPPGRLRGVPWSSASTLGWLHGLPRRWTLSTCTRRYTRGTFVCFVCFVAACPLPPRCHSTPTLWLHQLFAPGVRCNTVRLCVWIPVVLTNQSPALIYGRTRLPVVGRCCALGLYVFIGPVLPATEGALCQLLALASALLFLYLLSPCRRGLVGSGEGALRCHLPLFALLTRAGICSPPADCARVCCWYWHWRRGRAAPSGLAPALLHAQR
jgi:hypothetical protein